MLYHLSANTTVTLVSPFKAEAIAVIRSTKLAFDANQLPTRINFLSEDGDILLHISMRPGLKTVVFNSRTKDAAWQAAGEEVITFEDRFKNVNPTITIYDHGDRFQVLFDGATVKYFTKRSEKEVAAIFYGGDETKGLGFSNPLTVDVYASLAELL
jgi:Galactoside-binding lectin